VLLKKSQKKRRRLRNPSQLERKRAKVLLPRVKLLKRKRLNQLQLPKRARKPRRLMMMNGLTMSENNLHSIMLSQTLFKQILNDCTVSLVLTTLYSSSILSA